MSEAPIELDWTQTSDWRASVEFEVVLPGGPVNPSPTAGDKVRAVARFVKEFSLRYPVGVEGFSWRWGYPVDDLPVALSVSINFSDPSPTNMFWEIMSQDLPYTVSATVSLLGYRLPPGFSATRTGAPSLYHEAIPDPKAATESDKEGNIIFVDSGYDTSEPEDLEDHILYPWDFRPLFPNVGPDENGSDVTVPIHLISVGLTGGKINDA